ncbi:terminase small subunit [Tenacibaculum maritimum]|uniref:terminase small subunit n=1 Tax=Tenacibaculum maritimum TaxID=107401 RepID=UPI0038776AD4
MAAPNGNQFWKLRSKHGREKLFETPDLLYDACCEYFEWCDNTPIMEASIVKGNRVEEVSTPMIDKKGKKLTSKAKTTIPYDIAQLPKMRPYTLSGLCLYLDCNQAYFNQFESKLKKISEEYKTKEDKDFSKVITRVREIIYTQKFEGAATGLLNPNIIARDLGLADKKDLTSDGDKVSTIPLVLADGRTYEDLKNELKEG